ncbi:unnamed protein product [Mycena citricolor]|nr:unnamed protein product [Mycena citricolor]
MAKRMRRHSPERPSRSRSSDSQGETAADADSPETTTSQEPVAPTKKKRTRTLTTPHQSAVLHALLAQSRFPTTAVREEVGRSIGLSARKVQIWFQNQRQKARRPGAQPEATPQGSNSQQFSPFPNPSAPYASSSSHVLPADTRPSSSGFGSYSSEMPPQLAGPGIPGRSTSAVSRGRPILRIPSVPHHRDLPPAPFTSRSLPSLEPGSPEGSFSIRHDPSRILPPLSEMTRGRPIPPLSMSMFARSAPTTPSNATFPTSPSPSPTFAYYGHRPYSSSLGLPPPFTLQPAPQWDSSSSHAHSSLSRGSVSARDSSSSPPSSFAFESESEMIREDTPRDETPRTETSRAYHTGRYDPVRAMFVPYSPTSGNSPGPSSGAPPA